MKKTAFLLLLSCLSIAASAQYNYYRIAFGIGGGMNRYFGDIEYKPKYKPTISANLDYNFTPFASAGIEFQTGTITAGDPKFDPNLRYFKNAYKAIILGGKIQLGQVVDIQTSDFLYYVRGFYLGSGVGVVMNDMKEIVRIKPDGSNYPFPGLDKSKDLLIPANIGFNFDFPDQWGYTRFIFNINYQFNVTLGEGLDGYNDPKSRGFKNSAPDMFHNFTIGIKYCFGPEGLY